MEFVDNIEFETIELKVARDVVVFSFIVQKSLVYLNLSASDNIHSIKSIFTEEGCRKRLEPRRQILYTLHLDLPVDLETSLRDIVPNEDDEQQHEAFHLGLICVCECVYNRNLVQPIIRAIMLSENKPETLRKYLNVIKLLNIHQSRKTSVFLFDQLIHALYPHCTNSGLVLEFATTFKFYSWIHDCENPPVVGYVLHHTQMMRQSIWQAPQRGLDPINACIIFNKPANIIPLLEYGIILRFEFNYYIELLCKYLKRRNIRRIVLRNIHRRRLFLLLQLFYFKCNSETWEGLLYVWRSIPDPFISKREIRYAFRGAMSRNSQQRTIAYYESNIVEGSVADYTVPRPLQHLCRVVIRRALNCDYRLPRGISQLKIPDAIKAYLNLKS